MTDVSMTGIAMGLLVSGFFFYLHNYLLGSTFLIATIVIAVILKKE